MYIITNIEVDLFISFWCCWNVRGHGDLVCKTCDLIVCQRHQRNVYNYKHWSGFVYILLMLLKRAWPWGSSVQNMRLDCMLPGSAQWNFHLAACWWRRVAMRFALKWCDFLMPDVTFVKWRGHAVMWLSGAWCDLGLVPSTSGDFHSKLVVLPEIALCPLAPAAYLEAQTERSERSKRGKRRHGQRNLRDLEWTDHRTHQVPRQPWWSSLEDLCG